MSVEHQWKDVDADRYGNVVQACTQPGCGLRKVDNCSTFWQTKKGRKWHDVENEDMPECKSGRHSMTYEIKSCVRDLVAALDSTRWSSGCWCSGKNKHGCSATCAGRQAAITMAKKMMDGSP